MGKMELKTYRSYLIRVDGNTSLCMYKKQSLKENQHMYIGTDVHSWAPQQECTSCLDVLF